MKIILEPKHLDLWKTETDIDEYHKQNIEVYDFTDEEYNKFIEVINGNQASNKRNVSNSRNDSGDEKEGI